MPPRDPSQRSSQTSIISVDPVVASQITKGTRPGGGITTQSGHARTESTPARTTAAALAATAKGHGRTISAPNRNIKKRSNSLRRTKNSTEVLKIRTAAAEKSAAQTDVASIKRGRNFTVSNVGIGGTLHLSPSPHQASFTAPVSAPLSYPWASSVEPISAPATEEDVVAFEQSHTRTRSISPKRLLGRTALSKTSKEFNQRAHNRSQSFSTLDESRKSVHAAIEPRTLRIVINRPDSVHSSEDEELAPTLKIPIPHYKLGTPRFSAHGTPFMRGSNYARGSGVDSTNTSSMADGAGGPPLSSIRALSKIQYLTPSEESVVPMPDPLRVKKFLVNERSPSTASYVSPITANLYDKLLKVYDGPSVVRYANADKEIAAATKIRIIAQISSESFMDYDLVSDFFLTFRSYMTTFEVVDYLLARLKWSIGRLSDDGRIIRIRTFAALRHWILNYFAEDFVVNRHLRVRFCQEVNEMYESVKQRPRGTAGTSDLKILQDLKRCWNGRCALYWDADAFRMESDQEEPLLPGGVLGSRNPAYADISEATAALGLGLQGLMEAPLSSVSTRSTPRTQHKRLPSSEYAKKPLSVGSEHSIQPTSCSIIPRARTKSPVDENENLGRAPQLVSVLTRRQNAPSDLKVNIQQRREDEDVRLSEEGQATPVEALVRSGHYIDPHAGSMIRGFVYGPVEPFIQLPIDPPLSPAARFSTDRSQATSSRVPTSPQSLSQNVQGPAVKNIFGSIRRALSGKQGSDEVTLITVSGRRAPIPPHLARSHDDLRRKATGMPPKTQLRIDLLCAAAVQSFQAAVPGTQDDTPVLQQSQVPQESYHQLPFSPPLSSPGDGMQRPRSTRLPSHYTARSGSILIVDDTAIAMPVMSGALNNSYVHSTDQFPPEVTSPRLDSNDLHASFETQIALQEDENYNGVGEASSIVTRSSEIGLAKSTGSLLITKPVTIPSRTTSAITIKHLDSYPKSTTVEGQDTIPAESLRSTSPPAMTEATSNSESPISKAPTHGLRRRPGGDLRKNQNVHDMEIAAQHQSLASTIDASSLVGSVLITGASLTTSSPPAKRKQPGKVSMINTHSSQHLRPSFEAAVAGFSHIPDDDDGGLEATLLKLEGRYEDKSPTPSNPSMSPTVLSFATSSEKPYSTSTIPTDQEAVARVHKTKTHQTNTPSFLLDGKDSPDVQNIGFAHKPSVFGLPSESQGESDSEDSEISLPILKRKSTGNRAVETEGLDKQGKRRTGSNAARSSSDILDTRYGTSPELVRPITAYTEGDRSFLLDEDENISDLSSEISVDILTYTDTMGKPISPMFAAPGTAISGLEIPSHPLTHASLVNLSMQTSPALAGPLGFINQPLTPQQSPLLGDEVAGTSAVTNKKSLTFAEGIKPSITAGPAHVPFILACDSDVLAQQLTIVEQSALTEIEWTDLVEMRWSNDKSTTTVDWAEYMAKYDDARGVDVVATRFNLVIKWVLSEIVLTQDIGERARVLSKFIHIAAHARRFRNYATMLQITIALMSTSCTRLRKTWDLVPGHDKSVLKHMEKLAQPLRNFHDLRIEMESTDLTNGCIPFLGLYVHDLTYNAQKPTEIQIGDGLEPLINFERFRTGAIIIKGLLRLIDASLRYQLEPIHGIIERCLWLSALTDDRIDALSQSLE